MTLRRSRRHFLVAAACGALLTPSGAPLARSRELYRWRGIVLGGSAEMLLATADEAHAAALAQRCVAEIHRLEAIFSLYQPDSALCHLNRAGHLRNPPPEMLELLALSRTLWAASDGAFDPSVQPLWQARASGGDIPAALAKVGFEGVAFDRASVRLRRPGMALTFNGIAQGLIADKVTRLLRDAGLDRSLVQLGETRALGPRPDGSPWSIEIEDPARPTQGAGRIDLDNAALAVSAGAAGPLPGGGHHLLDPTTGASPVHRTAIAVRAPGATLADGLSTAAFLIEDRAVARLLARWPDVRAWSVAEDGQMTRLSV